MSEKVTVYIPTKNRAELLRKCLASVESQSYGNLEIIVVDDASEDNTAKVFEEFQCRDDRFRLIRLAESRGGCKARNIAIQEAEGVFVTGLDDDDFYEPYHVAALVEYWKILAKSGFLPSFLYTQAKRVRGNKTDETMRLGSVDSDCFFDSNYVGNQVFAPKVHYLGAGLFDESMPAWQDLEFFYRMTKLYGRAHLLDVPSYVFDDAPRLDRISSKRKETMLKACFLMHEKHGDNSNRKLQRLLLQVYSDCYAFNISVAEIYRFARLGFWPLGYMKLIKRFARRKAGLAGLG